MRLRALMAAAGIAVSAGPTAADWQFTWWGMTEAEAIAAGRGTLRPATPEDALRGYGRYPYSLGAVGDFWIGEVPVVGVFHFSDRGLRLVVFTPAGSEENCRRVRETMTAAYGAPLTADEDTLFEIVTWQAGRDLIRFVRTGERAAPVCSLAYNPPEG